MHIKRDIHITPDSSSFAPPPPLQVKGNNLSLSLLWTKKTPKLVWTLCKKTFIYSITIRTKIPRKDVLDVIHMLGVIIWNVGCFNLCLNLCSGTYAICLNL